MDQVSGTVCNLKRKADLMEVANLIDLLLSDGASYTIDAIYTIDESSNC
jgi:hypothetical protein